MKYTTLLTLVVTSALVTASSLPAATNTWSGASGVLPDQFVTPLTWTLFDTDPSHSPVLSGDTLTLANSASTILGYRQSGTRLSVPSHLVIEATMRFVSGTSDHPARAPAGITFYVASGLANHLFIDRDTIFLNSATYVRGVGASVDTDDAFHTYRIEVDGTTSGSSVNVYYDGALTLSGSIYDEGLEWGPEISWGCLSPAAQGSSEWRSFSHNAAVPSTALEIRVSQVELCWQTAPNLLYQLEYRDAFSTNGWLAFGPSVPGDGTRFCTNDFVLPGQPRRFYQLSIINAP